MRRRGQVLTPCFAFYRGRGFTLIELVIVTAILAVLAGLIIPAVQGAKISSDRAYCARNLHEIGVGYHLYLDQKNSSAFRGDISWMDQLVPYLDRKAEVFFCKSDRQHTQTAACAVRGGKVEGFAENDFQSVVNGPFDSGELDSQTQGGWNWNDLIIVVKPQAGGGVQLLMSQGSGDGRGRPSSSKDERPDAVVGDVQPLMPEAVVNVSSASYGVNCKSRFFAMTGDSQKLLVVEYKKAVANVVGPYASDDWATESAPRHRGMLNVLFKDGGVRDFGQFEIDPGIQQLYRQYWLPSVFDY